MRTILALIAGLFLCANAGAQGIPSDASGVYLGNDRVCRIVLSRYQTHWINVDLRCLTFAGAATVVNATRYSPGACFGDGAIQIDGQTGAGFLSLRSYASGSLAVVIDPNSVNASNGVGYNDTWTRVGAIQSPAPYTCGSAPGQPAVTHIPRLCRQFGLYCGG